ncbi:MAG TPA: hypothetical protein PKE51_14080 [Gemmatimonadaceae bacterium]|jgi:hypothetical protein|nr:hypothetical protein [Gemmatimonadaceae bacterium]
MSNPRLALVARILLGTALLMIVAGLYFLFVQQNTTVGAVLLAVGVGDVVGAIVLSRQRAG